MCISGLLFRQTSISGDPGSYLHGFPTLSWLVLTPDGELCEFFKVIVFEILYSFLEGAFRHMNFVHNSSIVTVAHLVRLGYELALLIGFDFSHFGVGLRVRGHTGDTTSGFMSARFS